MVLRVLIAASAMIHLYSLSYDTALVIQTVVEEKQRVADSSAC